MAVPLISNQAAAGSNPVTPFMKLETLYDYERFVDCIGRLCFADALDMVFIRPQMIPAEQTYVSVVMPDFVDNIKIETIDDFCVFTNIIDQEEGENGKIMFATHDGDRSGVWFYLPEMIVSVLYGESASDYNTLPEGAKSLMSEEHWHTNVGLLRTEIDSVRAAQSNSVRV